MEFKFKSNVENSKDGALSFNSTCLNKLYRL